MCYQPCVCRLVAQGHLRLLSSRLCIKHWAIADSVSRFCSLCFCSGRGRTARTARAAKAASAARVAKATVDHDLVHGQAGVIGEK